MSPIGGGKPLFDLIPNGRRAEGSDAPGDEGPRPGGGEGPGEPRRETSPWTGSVVVPAVWLYAGSGALIVLLVVMYGLAYRFGVSAERERWRGQASAEARDVFVSDPLAPPGAGGPEDEPESGASRPQPAVSSGAGPVLVDGGERQDDPRIEGNNYLELATLPREWAAAAVRYLTDQGIEAIAVPVGGGGRGVDRSGRGPNTSGSYRVIAVELAVPGDRYSALRRDRERLESRVKRAGKAWAESGGASDFSDPLWRRYGG